MSRKSAQPSWRKQGRLSSILLAFIGLGLAVLALYSPSLDSQLVYDSEEEIGQWNFIHDPTNLPVALTFRMMSLDLLDFNRPVAVTSLMLDSAAWGSDPFGYHLTSILLHGLVACLVFLFIRHLLAQGGDGRPRPWRDGMVFLAALLFAVHPILSEAVSEPSNRKDILAALFGLSALLVAARHRPEIRAGTPARLLLIPLLCLLAIGSKEVAVAYPVILALYWFLFRRGEPGRFWACCILGSAGVVVAFLIARFVLEHHPSVIFISQPFYPNRNLLGSFTLQPRILALYLFNLVWPAYLCADYGPYSIRHFPFSLSLIILVVIARLLAWWSARDRRALFASLFIAATLLPVCNLVPIYHAAADRYLYNPFIGLSLLLALALDSPWFAASFDRRMTAALVLSLLIALLIPVTLDREAVWSAEIPLWENTLQRNPGSFAGQVNLPEAYLRAGRLQDAKAASEFALKGPYKNTAFAWFDYALELNRLGDRPAAIAAAREAIRIKPDIIDADKMVLTLQGPRDLCDEFTQFVATLPPIPPTPSLDSGHPAR
jgi:hypothetical protein